MGRINIEKVKPGMIIDEDAVVGGNTLLTCGAELTSKHIDILRSWGVTDLEIKGVSNADIAADEMKHIDMEMVEIFEEQLKPLFALNKLDNPFIAELLRVSTLYNIEKNKQ
jgi:hypothetical protein